MGIDIEKIIKQTTKAHINIITDCKKNVWLEPADAKNYCEDETEIDVMLDNKDRARDMNNI